MSQSRTMSLVESTTNIGVGLLVSWTITWTLLPLWGFIPSMSEAVEISVLFTVVSLLRSYTLRRLFNRYRSSN